MHCCRDYDVVYWICLTSVLVHSVCDAWWGVGGQRGGMALWVVGVDLLCGNSWSTTTHILYSHVLLLCFCVFVTSANSRYTLHSETWGGWVSTGLTTPSLTKYDGQLLLNWFQHLFLLKFDWFYRNNLFLPKFDRF